MLSISLLGAADAMQKVEQIQYHFIAPAFQIFKYISVAHF
jgi:hypothetical protein